MEQRVSIITLGVKDLERSISFYEKLGWHRGAKKGEGIAFFRAGGVVMALYPRHELAKDANLATNLAAANLINDGHGFSGITLAYNTRKREEVDAVLAEAVTAGAKLLKPAQDAFWGGYSAYSSDPDGFAWEIAWNPLFEIAEDGRVLILD